MSELGNEARLHQIYLRLANLGSGSGVATDTRLNGAELDVNSIRHGEYSINLGKHSAYFDNLFFTAGNPNTGEFETLRTSYRVTGELVESVMQKLDGASGQDVSNNKYAATFARTGWGTEPLYNRLSSWYQTPVVINGSEGGSSSRGAGEPSAPWRRSRWLEALISTIREANTTNAPNNSTWTDFTTAAFGIGNSAGYYNLFSMLWGVPVNSTSLWITSFSGADPAYAADFGTNLAISPSEATVVSALTSWNFKYSAAPSLASSLEDLLKWGRFSAGVESQSFGTNPTITFSQVSKGPYFTITSSGTNSFTSPATTIKVYTGLPSHFTLPDPFDSTTVSYSNASTGAFGAFSGDLTNYLNTGVKWWGDSFEASFTFSTHIQKLGYSLYTITPNSLSITKDSTAVDLNFYNINPLNTMYGSSVENPSGFNYNTQHINLSTIGKLQVLGIFAGSDTVGFSSSLTHPSSFTTADSFFKLEYSANIFNEPNMVTSVFASYTGDATTDIASILSQSYRKPINVLDLLCNSSLTESGVGSYSVGKIDNTYQKSNSVWNYGQSSAARSGARQIQNSLGSITQPSQNEFLFLAQPSHDSNYSIVGTDYTKKLSFFNAKTSRNSNSSTWSGVPSGDTFRSVMEGVSGYYIFTSPAKITHAGVPTNLNYERQYNFPNTASGADVVWKLTDLPEVAKTQLSNNGITYYTTDSGRLIYSLLLKESKNFVEIKQGSSASISAIRTGLTVRSGFGSDTNDKYKSLAGNSEVDGSNTYWGYSSDTTTTAVNPGDLIPIDLKVTLPEVYFETKTHSPTVVAPTHTLRCIDFKKFESIADTLANTSIIKTVALDSPRESETLFPLGIIIPSVGDHLLYCMIPINTGAGELPHLCIFKIGSDFNSITTPVIPENISGRVESSTIGSVPGYVAPTVKVGHAANELMLMGLDPISWTFAEYDGSRKVFYVPDLSTSGSSSRYFVYSIDNLADPIDKFTVNPGSTITGVPNKSNIMRVVTPGNADTLLAVTFKSGDIAKTKIFEIPVTYSPVP